MNKKLIKYFGGELSEEEKDNLFSQLLLCEENKAKFIQIQNTFTLTQLSYKPGDEAWAAKKFSQLQHKIQRRKNKQTAVSLLRYAAIGLLLITGTWFCALHYLRPNQNQFTEIQVPKGQHVHIIMPDGTEAWLRSRTKIKIPTEFHKKSREIELDGEGFFSVTKNEQQPFVIKTKAYNINVLGTQFNVFAYSESSTFETNLLEGAIHVYGNEKSDSGIYLNPNEKVTLENGCLVKSISPLKNIDYLKNGIFSFESQSFGQILEYLSLGHDILFNIKSPELLDYKITGKFRQQDSIEHILRALQGIYTFKYKILSEKEIEIY